MKHLNLRAPAVAVVAIVAALAVFYLLTADVIDRNASTAPAGDANNETSGGSQPVFTSFESPRQLPNLSFMNRKNREITLEAFRGSYVLLNVWATWCAPCREEMPALDRLQETMGGPDFHVLPLSIDEAHPAIIRKFYEDLDLRFLYIYHDPSGAAFSRLKLPAIPATLLLDPNGIGMGYVVGPVEWDSPEIIRELRSYLSN